MELVGQPKDYLYSSTREYTGEKGLAEMDSGFKFLLRESGKTRWYEMLKNATITFENTSNE